MLGLPFAVLLELTATAIIAATETIRPPWRTFRQVASSQTEGHSPVRGMVVLVTVGSFGGGFKSANSTLTVHLDAHPACTGNLHQTLGRYLAV